MTGKIVLSMFAAAALAFGAAAKEVRLLTIGNSFADSVFAFLPAVAESAGDKIIMDRANLGGCSLERHWKLMKESDADPTKKIYQGKKANLRDMLEKDKWDFITIQQVSSDSWRPASFQPYAKDLQAYVTKYAPQAELLMQQTWAYRFDDNRLGNWKISQQEMFEKLVDAYGTASKELGIRQIPTGEAVQLARETQPTKYVEYDREALKQLKHPDALPSETGSFVWGLKWQDAKNKETGEVYKKIGGDSYHLNHRGQYLQACLWYAMLFDKPTSGITFVPTQLTAEDAAFLRTVAQKALDAHKEANKQK